MTIRMSLGCTVAALTLAALGGSGLSTAQAAVPSRTASPVGSQTVAAQRLTLPLLAQEVLERVRTEYPTVTTLMLASGESPSGPTRDMAQVSSWEFVVNNSAQGPIGSVDVRADLDGSISAITPHAQRWGGVLPISLPITMDPAEAYRILVAAGHDDPFQYVSLVKPLVADPHEQYHFSDRLGSGDGWAVNVDEPHTVSPILGGSLGAPC